LTGGRKGKKNREGGRKGPTSQTKGARPFLKMNSPMNKETRSGQVQKVNGNQSAGRSVAMHEASRT